MFLSFLRDWHHLYVAEIHHLYIVVCWYGSFCSSTPLSLLKNTSKTQNPTPTPVILVLFSNNSSYDFCAQTNLTLYLFAYNLMYLLNSILQNHRMVEFVRDCWRLSCLAKIRFLISNLNLSSRQAIQHQIAWPWR